MHYTAGELDREENEVALSGSITAKVKSCLHNKSGVFPLQGFTASYFVFGLLCSCHLVHGNTDFMVCLKVKSELGFIYFFNIILRQQPGTFIS